MGNLHKGFLVILAFFLPMFISSLVLSPLALLLFAGSAFGWDDALIGWVLFLAFFVIAFELARIPALLLRKMGLPIRRRKTLVFLSFFLNITAVPVSFFLAEKTGL